MQSLYIKPSKYNNYFKTKLTPEPGVMPIGAFGKFIPIPKASIAQRHSFQLSRQGTDLILVNRVNGKSFKTGF